MPESHEILDALVAQIGEQLDQQPTLPELAERSGYSPFHLHRRFTAVYGETPKQHIIRVRLERAAYLVAITDESLLRIALDVGFRSHETFTRAFRRRFGMAPVAYRTAARIAQRERLQQAPASTGVGYQLSPAQAVILAPARLLCSRHTGAYADVRMAPFQDEDQIWNPLVHWAQTEGRAHERTAWVMCLDDPTVTDGPRQRLDACIPLLDTSEQKGPFTLMDFGGGWYAGVEHVGPYDSIIQAYRSAADWVRRSSVYTFGTGTPVQIFRHVDRNPDGHRTEVFLPIVRR